jgi:hypothetical protein
MVAILSPNTVYHRLRAEAPQVAAVQDSGTGIELPIRDVRFHGESRGISGRAANIAKRARLTHIGHATAKFFIPTVHWIIFQMRSLEDTLLHSDAWRVACGDEHSSA